MRKAVLGTLKILVPIALGIWLVLYFYRQLDERQRSELFTAFGQANIFWLLLSTFLGWLSHVSRGYRWRYLLDHMGYQPGFWNCYHAVMGGYFMNMLLPRAGEASRAAMLYRTEGVPFEKGFGTILAERAVDMIMLLGIAAVTLFLQADKLDLFQARIAAFRAQQGGPSTPDGSSGPLGLVDLDRFDRGGYRVRLLRYDPACAQSAYHGRCPRLRRGGAFDLPNQAQGALSLPHLPDLDALCRHVLDRVLRPAHHCGGSGRRDHGGLYSGLCRHHSRTGGHRRLSGVRRLDRQRIYGHSRRRWSYSSRCAGHGLVAMGGPDDHDHRPRWALATFGRPQAEPAMSTDAAIAPRNQHITDRVGIVRLANIWRVKGDRIVFTNGVFDLMHRGHVTYLEEAAALGDRLVIGLNSDASVKRLGKGTDRPLNDQDSRAKVLSALRCVDAVVIFDEDTPLDLITALRPDVLVKGGDWSPERIVGADLVKAAGGSVHSLPLVEGFSTTALLTKIRAST
ncbi:MAG: D-glycero-beta-D-manno-heptose 1-phosphate adenylyltransferase [Flavobacteriales bacterium]|nr:D-glycero-beta-D-manno-heptose 1-phosphate adenylyltransferase [Flavobacteriales bacterium]